ncbi:MAG: FHA domain-containing protein [Planctomycetaceae bacterium]|nr:FHA domain-containing protein [Planctomycetaceae bacterium]MCA9032006.1 FHA domain-containing protein [Planctomycetaceae bacterium]MCB9953621.1 FHA domain-containing protein [Planctomycetaceae bacterium]
MLHLNCSAFSNDRVPLQPGHLLLIGRGSQCDIQLDDPSASRVHCRLLARDGKVFLTDAGSRWGTYVNGQRVTECELRPGDQITVGETTLTLQAEGTPDATTLARHSEVLRPWEEKPVIRSSPRQLPLSREHSADVQVAAVSAAPLVVSEYVGSSFLRYDVGELIERTATGLIFRAQAFDGVTINLQLFHPATFADDRACQRFLRAIETVRGLAHPNLEQIDDGGVHDGILFLATRHVPGQTAAQLIREMGVSGMLDWRRTLSMACDLASALEYLEEQGVVHRNITPEHIRISDDGRAILGGLLLAKALDDSKPQLTQAGEVLGDAAYESPEQLGSGEPVDVCSDLYQLGATLYALLTGRPPFKGRTGAETIAHVLTAPPVPPTKYHLAIPALLEGLILRLLSKRPQDRLPSAISLVKELESVQRYCGM